MKVYKARDYFGPAESKDPNETRADEMSDDSTDDELINNWIQEAAGFSPLIEGKPDSPSSKNCFTAHFDSWTNNYSSKMAASGTIEPGKRRGL